MAHSLLVVLVLFATSGAFAHIFHDGFSESELDSFVQATMGCRHVPAMTVSVVKGSDTWAKGYGTDDFAQSIAADNTTLFNIGSVTKSFTMTLLANLLTENNMDWTAKIADIMGPDYGFIDGYRTSQMTLRDLLTHRTGLARLDIGLLQGFPDALSREQFSKRMKFLPEQIPFRDGFIYNNYMYALLGHVAEKLGGDTWENLVQSRVLDPIGMESTRILLKPSDVFEAEGVARPYIWKDGEFHNGTRHIYTLHPWEPGCAILSNGVDMVKYMRFNLNNGKTDAGVQLVDKELFVQAFKGITRVNDELIREHYLTAPTFPVPDTPTGYGYAWLTSSYNGYRRLWHSGQIFSYFTLLWMFPDTQTGIFASVNGPLVGSLASHSLTTSLYYISDRLLGEEPWINATTSCTFPEPWLQPNKAENPPLETPHAIINPGEYSGTYGAMFLPSYIITPDPHNNTRLIFESNKLGGFLHSTPGADRFLVELTWPFDYVDLFKDDNNVTLTFNATFHWNEGKVTHLQIKYEVDVYYKKDMSILDRIPTTSAASTYCTTMLIWPVLLGAFYIVALQMCSLGYFSQ